VARLSYCTIPAEGAPSLRFLQGRASDAAGANFVRSTLATLMTLDARQGSLRLRSGQALRLRLISALRRAEINPRSGWHCRGRNLDEPRKFPHLRSYRGVPGLL